MYLSSQYCTQSNNNQYIEHSTPAIMKYYIISKKRTNLQYCEELLFTIILSVHIPYNCSNSYITLDTYSCNRGKEFRSRWTSSHESSSCYVFWKIKFFRDSFKRWDKKIITDECKSYRKYFLLLMNIEVQMHLSALPTYEA